MGFKIDFSKIIIPSIYTFLQIVILTLFGFFLSKFAKWSKVFFKYTSLFIVNFSLPSYFFTSISKTNRVNIIEGAIFPFFAFILLVVTFIIAYFLFSLFKIKGEEKRVGIALSVFGNSGYIPISLIEILPVTLPFLAEKFDSKVSILFIGTYLLVNSPMLWSIGNFLVSSEKKLPSLKEFFTPPLFGIIAGLVVVIFNFQSFIFDKNLPFYYIFLSLEKIGSVTLPLIMISLGSMIAELRIEKDKKAGIINSFLISSIIRFVLSPFLYWILFFFIIKRYHFTPIQNWVIFLEMHNTDCNKSFCYGTESREK